MPKRKSKRQLKIEADKWLKDRGIAPTKEERADIVDGLDRDLVICPTTGRMYWREDLQDQKKIRKYKETKPWLNS